MNTSIEHILQCNQSEPLADASGRIVHLMNGMVCQGERTKFDRFVDLNVRGAQRRVYSDLRIY